MLTQERLKQLVSYCQETGEMTWVVDRSNVRAGQLVGSKRPDGYVVIGIDGRLYLRHRLAWLFVHGMFPPKGLDHANGVKGDDRIENLRLADHSQNMANTKRPLTNKSGVKGVHFHPKTGKWRVQVGCGKTRRHVGLFDSKKQAADAYKKAAIERWGEYARTA